MPPLLERGAEYEPVSLEYREVRPSKYVPDVVFDNGIAVEIKGWFRPADRAKLIAVKKEYPLLDLRIVLERPSTTLSKGSTTSLWRWCNRHGFPWVSAADGVTLRQWSREPVNAASKAILDAAPRRKVAA